MKKFEGTFKGGRKWYHWKLIVHLDDGSTQEVAKFAREALNKSNSAA
jgi:hypothetical protein